MPKPPASSSSGRGRPPRAGSGKGSGGRTGKGQGQRQREGPPWKQRADDDAKGKKAGWGGVARKGAGRMRDAGPGNASKAFRAATPEGREVWEPEVWIDEGTVRGAADRAVGRARAGRRPAAPGHEGDLAPDPSLRRAVPAKSADRLEARLKEAGKAFRRERFEEARSILRPLAEQAPTAESVRELLGLTYYRLGRWKPAVTELEAFRELSGSTEQHPVLADCYRALGRHAKVVELWEELRAASPGAALVAEGRIVYAGSLADQGRLDDAIAVLAASKPPTKRPKPHHLRVTYALADLYERAGDVPKARQLFTIVAAADPDLGDVQARLRALK
jgi:thioredoxin-like negative regulator of GroEL